MKRNIFETLLGALIIFGAIFFLTYSYKVGNASSTGKGYEVFAFFSGIGGLQTGDDVQISGVKIGTVKGVELDQETYLAKVSLEIGDEYKLPVDTAAMISSESLLGGKYLLLEPGAEEEMLENGGRIEYTQAPQNLEQLLGQFIFNMQGDDKKGKETDVEAAQEPAL
ncbi:MAG: outer membrane lipid asymmetry maintenance protein MlaD [Micavibrio sp.]|nr:outer membrane lipid asymmetry maintenance protein MlaD [Micavibrio sp.]